MVQKSSTSLIVRNISSSADGQTIEFSLRVTLWFMQIYHQGSGLLRLFHFINLKNVFSSISIAKDSISFISPCAMCILLLYQKLLWWLRNYHQESLAFVQIRTILAAAQCTMFWSEQSVHGGMKKLSFWEQAVFIQYFT